MINQETIGIKRIILSQHIVTGGAPTLYIFTGVN